MSRSIGRRTVSTGLVALGLGLSPRARAAQDDAARKEGAVTWYTAHTDVESAEAAGRAFTAVYPEIKVTVIRTTAQVAYQRLLQDIKTGTAQCDVFSSTDLGHDETLRATGKFAKYTPVGVENILPAFQGLDPAGTYFATTAELCVLLYNSAKVGAEDAPKTWKDLLDPKWKNRVTVGHPGFSGTVGTWVVTLRDLYGWSFFEQLEKGKPQIGRSVNDSVTTLNSGERWVAMGPLGLATVTASRGNPIVTVMPQDGAVIVVSPSAVMANAPHPNAARLFMDFLVGPGHGAVMAAQARVSVCPLPSGAGAIPPGKILRPTVTQIVKGIPDAIEQWRDLFGN